MDGDPNSFARNVTVDEYAFKRVQQLIVETSRDDIKAFLEGMLATSYRDLAIGEDDRAAGDKLFAKLVYDRYTQETATSGPRISLPPLGEIDREIRGRMLDPERGLPLEARQIIRTKLGLGPETVAPPPTNAPPPGGASPPTNAPPAKAASG